MYLLIDTSEKLKIHLTLFDERFVIHKTYSGQNRELLNCIQKLVESKKYKACLPVGKVESMGGIAVVVGVGGFTSTRVACVVANTFAYVLQIPVLAVKPPSLPRRGTQGRSITDATSGKIDVQKLIHKLLKQPKGQYISATYSGEVNIGKKFPSPCQGEGQGVRWVAHSTRL